MKNIDNEYKVELNFIDEFNLNRNGMIKEIKTEFDIIRLCLQEKDELDSRYMPILDRIIIMPLRKLLCEKESVLLNVCPDFKMPCLNGFSFTSENQTIIRPPFKIEPIEQWVSVEQWLNQSISWFDRDVNNIAKFIPQFSYECIIKKLNAKKFKPLKPKFEVLFLLKQVEYQNEIEEIYCRKNPTDKNESQEVYDILEQIGYNKLSIYDFLKHMSDKRGAHIDVGHSLVVGMINDADRIGLTPVYYFAIQMIYAAKKQVPELAEYWPEMPDLSV
mgnify:CR=1 FL=1